MIDTPSSEAAELVSPTSTELQYSENQLLLLVRRGSVTGFKTVLRKSLKIEGDSSRNPVPCLYNSLKVGLHFLRPEGVKCTTFPFCISSNNFYQILHSEDYLLPLE